MKMIRHISNKRKKQTNTFNITQQNYLQYNAQILIHILNSFGNKYLINLRA